MNVHGSFIFNSHQLETIQQSNLGMNQQIVVYPFNRTLLSHQKEQVIDTLTNMDKSQ